MGTSVEKVSQLERRMTVVVPSDEVEPIIKKRLEGLAKTAKIDGFRPGHVPLSVIEQHYGQAVRQEALEELLQTHFFKALSDEKLDMIGYPKIDVVRFKTAEPLEFTATFEIFPTVTLLKEDTIEIEKFVGAVSEKDIDQMIESLRKQQQTFEPVKDRAAQMEDQLILDFDGTIDGKPFPGNSAKDFRLILGAQMVLPDLEQGLVGLKIGETKTISVHFPKDYHAKELADKTAEFTVMVKEMLAPHLPEVDDDLAKLFGIQEGGLAALRKDLLPVMDREMQIMLRDKNKAALMEKLLSLYDMELPKALLEEEMKILLQEAKTRQEKLQAQFKMEMPPVELSAEQFKGDAERRVKLGIILRNYVQHYQFQVTPEARAQLIEEIVRMNPDPEGQKNKIKKDAAQMARLDTLIVENQVVDKLLGSAKVKERPVGYFELIQMRGLS